MQYAGNGLNIKSEVRHIKLIQIDSKDIILEFILQINASFELELFIK